MDKLKRKYKTWVGVAFLLDVSPNYVRMCASENNTACFSLKLAEKAVLLSDGATTVKSLRKKAEARKLLCKNNNKK
jgi:hypothetical protein